MILDMPFDMVKASIVPFFTLRDIVVYHSALGPNDTGARTQFDALIQYTELPHDRSVTINDHSAQWMSQHRVYALDLVVAATATGMCLPYFQAHGHLAASLTFHNCTLLSGLHLQTILYCCSKKSVLKSFDVFGSNAMDAGDVRSFLRLNQQLRHLSLDFDSHLLGSLYQSPYVESIDLSGCVNINNLSIMLIAKHCKQLRSIDLSNAMFIADAAVNALATEASQLESLLMCRSAMITGGCLVNFCAERGSRLRVLGINGMRCGPNVLSAIADHLPNLRELRLLCYSTAHNADFTRLVQSCAQLRVLEIDVGRLRCLSSEGLFPFSRLEKLIGTEARDGQLLDAHLLPAAAHWASLRHLELMLNEAVTDAAVAGIASHCSLLQVYHLFGGAKLSDAPLIAICKSNPHLRAITLTCARLLTDEVLLAIGRHCPSIATLEVGKGKRVTDVGVAGLALQAPGLRALSLPHSVLLTDQTLHALAAYTPLLTSLNLTRSSHLTAAAIQHVLQRCKCLRSLDVERGTLSFVIAAALEKRYGIRELQVRVR